MFITRLLAEGRATADPPATLLVLHHLAHHAHEGQHTSKTDLIGSEEAFVAVLQTANLQGDAAVCSAAGQSVAACVVPGFSCFLMNRK